VKANTNNVPNEIAAQLTKKAACGKDGKTAYRNLPKSAVIKAIQGKGKLQWQADWNVTTKGEITKTFFPDISVCISKRLRMCVKLVTVVTGHGTLRSYYHRFKVKNNPECCS